ncbi:MAG: aminotransferase class I/II-fold pyridoxal phosphate-dependent enzyme [Gemmatimonadota bacterium]|nr:aminotransferase class I/II-fold pyridoxal phosphate-dependent enzyme [Gemmatimonadota bacterium]
MSSPSRSESTRGLPLLDLSRNEGDRPSSDVLGPLGDRLPDLLRDYLEPSGLEADLARLLGVDPDRVLVTTGGDDALDRVFRAFLRSGRKVVYPVPTFEMIPAFARMADARVQEIAHEWGALPLDELALATDAETDLVAVISPDNPTGTAATTEELVALAGALPGDVTLLVDQAYIEFGDEDPSAALLEFANVVLVRTLSKAWGLAGLRVGYAVSTSERIAAMRDVGGPYPVSSLGLELARQRLATGQARMEAFVAETRERRTALMDVIRLLGGDPIPSQANFVTARFPRPTWVAVGLRAQGIRVRSFPHLPEHVRITVPRSAEELDRLTAAAKELIRPQALLFDMDGVLADVGASYREAIIQTGRSYGFTITPGDVAIAKARGNANDDWALTHEILLAGGIEAELAEVTRRFEDLYQGSGVRPGLRETEALILSREGLEAAAARGPLGIVTGRPRVDAHRFLREQGIDDLFKVVVCREDAALKPSPEPVLLALEEMGVSTAWYYGDTPDDMRAATEAGVIPVGVIAPGGGEMEREALIRSGAATTVAAAAALSATLDMEEVAA